MLQTILAQGTADQLLARQELMGGFNQSNPKRVRTSACNVLVIAVHPEGPVMNLEILREKIKHGILKMHYKVLRSQTIEKKIDIHRQGCCNNNP